MLGPLVGKHGPLVALLVDMSSIGRFVLTIGWSVEIIGGHGGILVGLSRDFRRSVCRLVGLLVC